VSAEQIVPLPYSPDSSPPLRQSPGGIAGFLLAFAVLHGLLVQLGYALKGDIAAPSVMWPGAGLICVALWLAPWRLWPVVLAVQFAVEIAMAGLWVRPFDPGIVAAYTSASTVGALLGSRVACALITEPWQLRARHVGWFVLAAALGSLANALIGATVNQFAYHGGSFLLTTWLRDLQLWWAGNWLGTLVVAPLVVCWLSPLRRRHVELALSSGLELVLVTLVLAGLCVWVYSSARGTAHWLLQLPPMIFGVMVYAAVRLPPRWTTTLFAMTALICSWLLMSRLGVFPADELFVQLGRMQTFLAALGMTSLALTLATAERNIVAGQLQRSRQRYRNFVEHSTEALWRIELHSPMPVALPVVEQARWLRAHARVVETSRSYHDIDPAAADADDLPWRREVAWSAAFEDNLAQAARRNYAVEGLRFTSVVHGRRRSFVASFSGMVQDGRLQRLWGVARDITELVHVNERLVREQQRLKSYAGQISRAEEKARRATAVDLHDGIGQVLAGMAMTLDVARQRAPTTTRPLLDEARTRLKDVQERTRHMISDLSPPGLYDLGLAPALQWLRLHLRGQDHLYVDLDVEVDEERIPLELRVLVFKLVRELLRNAARHAGVDRMCVQVRSNERRLLIEVSDQGRGFEWQADLFSATPTGSSLWSIAERVQEAGGRFDVDSAPGRGARFEVTFPLQQMARTG
jgi:signal transduction histidine kinase